MIGDQTFFKLRDIAYILSTSEKRFEVEWVSKNSMIKILPGESYIPTGVEMAIFGKEDKKVVATSVFIEINENISEAETYKISGNYYFSLETLSALLNLNISSTMSGYEILTYLPIILAAGEDAGQEYIDSIIFLGDSTTNGLIAYAILFEGKKTTQVWVPANKTFSLFNQSNIKIVYPESEEELTIEAAVSIKKPKYMVLTLGINGVASMIEESFKTHYTELIKRILEANPTTKIILNSIYPVARNYGNLDKINNDKINTANEWILQLATELDIRFLETDSVLKDEEGWLPANYQNGDGLHLAPIAYQLIIKYIRTHPYK